MGLVHPFRGLSPARDRVEKVASRPFDKYSAAELSDLVKTNPESFVNVIRPDLASGKRVKGITEESLRNSRKKFEEFEAQGTLVRQPKPCFYIYRQVKPHFVYTGLVATIDAEAYRDGRIRIHEQTLAPKEEKLKDYLKVVAINAEPVMFTYPHQAHIDALMYRLTAHTPYASFEADNKQHLLWIVDQDSDIEALLEAFEAVNTVYVADGHHRSASSVLLAEESPEGHPARRFMGIFLPDHNLQLLEFNRLLKDTGGLQLTDIIAQLEEDFDVNLLSVGSFKPGKLHEFSMYFEGKWFQLRLRSEHTNSQLGDKLDANILSQRILSPIFGIHDLRNDPRIGFISGLSGVEGMKEAVDSGQFKLAFGLYPVSFEQFFDFSDRGKIMPPKTTWFEPKLLNGLVIYDLEPS